MKRAHETTTRSGAGAPPEPGAEEAEGVEACAICLSPRALDSNIDTVLVCAHGFHQSCIQQWLADHDACPVCRTAVEGAGAGAGAEFEAGEFASDPQEGFIFIDGARRSVFRAGVWVPVDAEAEALLAEAVRTGRMALPGELRGLTADVGEGQPRVMVMPYPAHRRWVGVPLEADVEAPAVRSSLCPCFAVL